MKPSEVAARLGIASSTIRAWTLGEYRQFFSPTAQGGAGMARDLTETDARILAYIHELKGQGKRHETVMAALRQMQENDWINLPLLPDSIASARVVSTIDLVPRGVVDASVTIERTALLREILSLKERIDELKAQQDADREKIEQLIARAAEAETELRLYRAGRIKPDSSST